MVRSKRLRQIADVTEARVKDACRAMAESRRAFEQSEAQLSELRSYRDEYRKKSDDYQGGGDPRRLSEYRMFLMRLDEATRHQENLVRQAQIELERKTAEWRGHQTHQKALEKVVERFQGQEHEAADRREQRESDDIRPVFRLKMTD